MHFYRRFLPRLNQRPTRPLLTPVPPGDSIPRILHQTYFTHALPPELAENVARLKALNPGWEYRFYADEDIAAFIRSHYDERVWAYFSRINPAYGAARADLFRYLVVYRCGGVYLDIKSTVTRPLDEVIRTNDRFLLSYWQNKPGDEFEGFGWHPELDPETGEFQQWHVIAAPGHPFLKAVIENVFRNIDTYLPSLHGAGQHGVVRVTGPVAYTLAITPLLGLHPHRLAPSEAGFGLRYSVFKKFSHMHISKGKHYTVLKDSIVLLSPAKQRLSRWVGHLQACKDGLENLLGQGKGQSPKKVGSR